MKTVHPLRHAPAALVALFSCPLSGSAQSPAELRAGVEEILGGSPVASATSDVEASFTDRVAALGCDLTSDEIARVSRAVGEAFASAAMRSDVVDFMATEAASGDMDRVLSWYREGSSAEVRESEQAYVPSLSLDEFAFQLETSVPLPARIALMQRWVSAQSAGDFSIILEEVSREAAHEVLRALRGDAPDFAELSRAAYEQAHDRYTRSAVLSFLYRFEPVPDEVLAKVVDEYESEAGQWFVETYTFAIAEAVWLAGQRAARTLAGDAVSRTWSGVR